MIINVSDESYLTFVTTSFVLIASNYGVLIDQLLNSSRSSLDLEEIENNDRS